MRSLMLLAAFTAWLTGCAGARAPVVLPLDLPPPLQALSTDPGNKFEDGLEAAVRAEPQDRRFQVLVDLTDQLDLAALRDRVLADPRGKAAKRRAVVALFEQVAEQQQSTLRPVLDRWVDEGLLDYWQGVAVVNRLVVEGSAAGILRLARRSEVHRVLAEWGSESQPGVPRPPPSRISPPRLGERFTSWAVEALGADRLWEQGLDGTGVVVGAIDTGASGDHEQLAGRQLEGERAWFDPVRGQPEPYDNHGHGTSVLSQAVGGNPGGRVVGIAPGARWAAALGNWQNRYSRTRMTLAADWMLRVARPDVLINAWSHNHPAERCVDFDLAFINAWKAAGIFVVFPAGNAGPDSASGEAPAQLTGTFPTGQPVFSVAALGPDGEIDQNSSRGPSSCGSPAFPSVAAPGTELPAATPVRPDGYAPESGTSLAAGLVGGAAALLLQAEPETDPWDLQRVLIDTAQDLPPRGRDAASGAGAIHLPTALRLLRERAASGKPGR